MTTAAHPARACWRVLLLAALTFVLSLLLPAVPASAAALPAAETRVGVSGPATAVAVGVHESITAGQRPVRGPSQLQMVVGNCVAAEGVAPRFIGNAAGDVLDTTRVTVPGGKPGYLVKDPRKSGIFADRLGFDEASMEPALRSHLTSNFGSASGSVPMLNGVGEQIGTKFLVRGPMTGPSGRTFDITASWGVDYNGTVRFLTAFPGG